MVPITPVYGPGVTRVLRSLSARSASDDAGGAADVSRLREDLDFELERNVLCCFRV